MITTRRIRQLVTATAAAGLLASGAIVAGTSPAAAQGPSRPTGRHHQRAESTSASQPRLPAPPRPPKSRPTQRTITRPAAGGATGSGAVTTTAAMTGSTAVTTTAAGAGSESLTLSTMRSTTSSVVTAAGPAPAPAPAPGAPTTGAKSGAAAPGGGTAKTLVLYDTTGDYAWLGEAYATLSANLISRFGSWTAHPVGTYQAGELAGYSAVVYIGSTYDEPVPIAFLDDVLATTKPVVWAYDNVWQLTARQESFAATRGFTWQQFDFSTVAEVRYRDASLTREKDNTAGIMQTVVTDPTRATVLATAVRSDGTTLPWAVRSGNLTYVGEVPYAYVTHDDRYLAFCDLLYDALAPTAPARHRALVRIEDVGPDADPAQLRAVADYLYSKKVPYTVAVYPRYRDPKGVGSNGIAQDYTLWQKPKVVSALRYMQSRGGTLLMHGYTHQYGNVANPYDGVSGNDFEFYAAHVDASDRVIYDGPVAGDTTTWANSRITAASTEFLLAGLGSPTMFEFPHYAASATDYQVVAGRFTTRYERGLYFGGSLTGGSPNYSHMVGQFFPYPVRDVYGTAVVPENIGNVEPEAYNTHPVRLPADLVASAKRNLVVRDGVASFFYHPYLGTDYLKQAVEGVQGLGYTFVAASATMAR